MEKKFLQLELKDFSPGSRTAVLAHAVYDVIDRLGDISRKGMFNKSWQEYKSIDFLFNHKTDQIPGNVNRTWEDEQKAYTEVKFGDWTLGNDVMNMADAGVLRGVSFGYVVQKKNFITVKGKKVRELKEVFHGETSVLTNYPANPLAGVVTLTKDANGILLELKEHIELMEKFVRNSKASDEAIIKIANDLAEAKAIFDKYDTVGTLDSAATQMEQPASVEESKDASQEVLTKLLLLNASIN